MSDRPQNLNFPEETFVPDGSYNYSDTLGELNIHSDKDLTNENVNGYFLWFIKTRAQRGYRDEQFWESFKEAFDGWTENTFQVGSSLAREDLRSYLRANGVHVIVKTGARMHTELARVVNEEVQQPWTSENIQIQLNKYRTFNSKFNPQNPTSGARDSMHMISENIKQESPLLLQQQNSQLHPTFQSLHQAQQQNASTELTRVNQINNYGRELVNLVKIYNTESQYGGAEDSLDLKLLIFQDLCRKSGLATKAYAEAFSTMLKGAARDYYYDHISNKGLDINSMISSLRTHFETDERRQQFFHSWNTISLASVISDESNTGKSMTECFEILLRELQRLQRGLSLEQRTDSTLRDKLLNACRDIKECVHACFKPASTFQALAADIRSSIITANRIRLREQETFFNGSNDEEVSFYTDRLYNNKPRLSSNQRYFKDNDLRSRSHKDKKCFICKKFGCWSTKHSQQDQKRSRDEFRKRLRENKKPYDDDSVCQFITSFEGNPEEEFEEIEQMIMDIEISNESNSLDASSLTSYFATKYGDIEGFLTVSLLNDISVRHDVTKTTDQTFLANEKYQSSYFQGIVIDSGAAARSSAGFPQFQALQKIQNVQLDTSKAGTARIVFGDGDPKDSMGTVDVKTPVGVITLHVVLAATPFLYCLPDMDKMQVRYDNLRNVLVQNEKHEVSVIRKFGHAFMLLSNVESTIIYSSEMFPEFMACHLTEMELRRLHRRFGHPSANPLIRLLKRSGHEFEAKTIKKLTNYCDSCQRYGKSPGRFKSNLRNDCEFNHSVFLDVMYLESSPILHVVDESTRFQAARWLKSMTAQHTWDALRACWIDVYIGPPDIITHDAGTNFTSKEFRQLSASMSILLHEVPVEAHHSVGRVERYHDPLRRAYKCIVSDMKELGTDKHTMLQMAIKAINDTAGPDGLVPTLLVFGAYPRMTDLDPPAPSIIQRASAIKSAMKEVQRCHAKRQVSDALRTTNGPRTSHLRGLPLNSEVLVYRENGGWTGPHKMFSMSDETCTIALESGPTLFRSTAVKLYNNEILNEIKESPIVSNEPHLENQNEKQVRPENDESSPLRRSERERRLPTRYRQTPQGDNSITMINETIILTAPAPPNTSVTSFLEENISTILITNKESQDMELSKNLRAQGIIFTPGEPFVNSRENEINSLLEKGVFEFVKWNPVTMKDLRIFNSRFVDEIKGKGTNSPYEKSRLVIQAHNDKGKEFFLTQLPTVHRSSQRLLLAIAPALAPTANLYLRDITQAYVQSTTKLSRVILAKPPKELKLPNDIIIRVIKPLYGVPESGTHWYRTYSEHHKENLLMKTSTFDPCLMISTKPQTFGVVVMQTDDTLFLGDQAFVELEESELTKAKFTAKTLEALTTHTPLLFNGAKLTLDKTGSEISLIQKGQADGIKLVDFKSKNFLDEYRSQRARGAYVASISQPECSFDLSVAAQLQKPSIEDVKALNKRLEWQINNKSRGLRFIPFKLQNAKLFVFVDASFANNKNFSSQIGYIIVMGNEEAEADEFSIVGNIIHWSSIKCKRVTRSVLASELYAMVQGVDSSIVISTTLKMIMKQLNIDDTPIVVCTDSFSLYECMVKLGTTKEKRLMIDIMALRQSYERREISEIRWINGNDNPADSMTKINPTNALESLINTNRLRVRVEGCVHRK